MGAWSWEARDLAGTARSTLAPRSVTVVRNLLRPSTLSVTLDAGAGDELSTTARVVRGWRRPRSGGDRVLRATGRLTTVNAAVAADAGETVTAPATDALGGLAGRQIQSATSFLTETPRDIVADLVADQDARHPTGLVVAAAAASGPLRDRNYEQGKNVLDAVQQLAEVDDGFYYRVDPYDDDAAWSELVILYPSPGAESGASFQWGDGTVGSLAGVEGDVLPPINHVTAFGSGEGIDQLRAERSDEASIAALGLFDVSLSLTDVTVLDTLSEHAEDALRPTETRVFRVQVALPSAELLIPEPWEDFDVGDTVELVLRGESPVLQFVGRALVTSFTVTIDENGVERLSALDLQGV